MRKPAPKSRRSRGRGAKIIFYQARKLHQGLVTEIILLVSASIFVSTSKLTGTIKSNLACFVPITEYTGLCDSSLSSIFSTASLSGVSEIPIASSGRTLICFLPMDVFINNSEFSTTNELEYSAWEAFVSKIPLFSSVVFHKDMLCDAVCPSGFIR